MLCVSRTWVGTSLYARSGALILIFYWAIHISVALVAENARTFKASRT